MLLSCLPLGCSLCIPSILLLGYDIFVLFLVSWFSSVHVYISGWVLCFLLWWLIRALAFFVFPVPRFFPMFVLIYNLSFCPLVFWLVFLLPLAWSFFLIVAVLVQNCFRSLLIHICLCLASVVAFLDLYLVFLVFCPPYVCLFFVFYLSVNVSLNSYVLVHVLFCMMFGVYG